MIELIQSIKDVIDEKVVGRRQLKSSVDVGSDTLNVVKAFDFQGCDCIILLENDCSEIHQIESIIDRTTIKLAEPVQRPFGLSTTIEKVYNGQRVETYLGNPPVLPRYPAITIDLISRESESLAIQLMQQTHFLQVSVYVSTESFESSYRLMHDLANMVETMLFRTMFPLVKPFAETTLTADANIWEDTIQVQNPNILGEQTDILLDADHSRTNHRIKADKGNGVFELLQQLDVSYPAGSRVIRPLTHIYDTHVDEIRYDDAQQEETTFKVAVLNYSLKLARLRGF